MTIQEKFLGLYREYESLLRAKGKDPKETEENAEPLESGRLRMCRQTRNYLSHTDDTGFAGISEQMIAFLQKKITQLKEEGDTAKKHVKKTDTCILKEDTKASEAFLFFKKLKVQELLVMHKDGDFGVLSVYELLGCRSTSKIGTLKQSKAKLCFCSQTDDYGSLDRSSMYLCTSDGTPDGKLLGQVWFS